MAPRIPYNAVPSTNPVGATVTPFQNAAKAVGGGSALRSIAGGLEGLGNEFQKLSNTQAAAAERQQADIDYYDNVGFQTDLIKIEEQEKMRLAEAARNASGSNGKGFAEKYLADHGKLMQKQLANVPPHLQAAWRQRYQALTSSLALRAVSAENSIRDATQQTQLKTTFDTMLKGIQDNPNEKDTYISKGEALIDQTNLPQAMKDEYKRVWKNQALMVWGLGQAAKNPKEVLTSVGNRSYLDKVKVAESGGRVSAKNPNSSASGLYQFTDGTWAEVVNSAAGRAAGLTLSGRGNPEQQRKAMEIFTANNARILSAAGIDSASHTNLYIAHFLGAGGAVRVLKAPPNDSIENHVSGDALRANKSVFYNKDGSAKSVGQVIGWAAKKMGGGSTAALNDLDFKSRNQVIATAQRQYMNDLRIETAQQKAAYQEQLNQIHIKVNQGLFTQEHLKQMVEGGQITNRTDISSIKSAITKYDKDGADANAFILKHDNGYDFNNWNKDDRRQTNAYISKLSDEQKLPAARDIAQNKGILPDVLSNHLRSSIDSGDPIKIKEAMQLGFNLRTHQPSLYKNSENGAAIEKALDFFNNKRRIGVDADRIVQSWQKFKEDQAAGKLPKPPEMVEFRKSLIKNAQSDIVKNFKGWLSTPDMPSRMRIQSSMVNEYVRLATEYREEGFNPEEAKMMAKGTLSKLYGVTNGRLMPLPPEKSVLPPLEGSHAWVYKQAATFAEIHHGNTLAGPLEGETKPGVKVDPKTIELLPLPATYEQIRTGVPPTYAIRYNIVNPETGQREYHELRLAATNGLIGWTPDYQQSKENLTEERATKFQEKKVFQKKLEELEPILKEHERVFGVEPSGDFRIIGDWLSKLKPGTKEPTEFEKQSMQGKLGNMQVVAEPKDD